MSDQLALFDIGPASSHIGDRTVGYRAPVVQSITGVTYRQLDYWARTDLIRPSVRGATGSGSQRLYSFADIVIVRVIKRLLDTGISLQNIRTAVALLRERGADDLSTITLISDGMSIYECTDADDVIDLLAGGQAVFGIALGQTVADVRGSVHQFPAESAMPGSTLASGHVDELAERRRAG